MKNLLDPVLVDDTKRRILALRADSERHWGSLGLAQMLAHCTSGIEMATGALCVKRASFPLSLIGLLVKPLVLRDDKPMRRNSPSLPELFQADSAGCDFLRERARLIAAVDEFAGRSRAGCSGTTHPFFGPLTSEQWAILMYKHLDHHLRQFGV